MDLNCKIVIDTCVLIAASINHPCSYIPGQLTEDFYPISKPLLDYIKNNNINDAYVLEISVEKARNKFSEIIMKHIEKISLKHSIEKKAMMDEHSFALIKVNDSLNEHITYLKVLPREDKHLLEIKQKIREFYLEVRGILIRNSPRNITRARVRAAGRFKWFEKKIARQDERREFKTFNKLLNKFKNNNFDDEDITILSQAAYFKKEMQKEEKKLSEELNQEVPDGNVYLVSTDYHLSEINSPSQLSSIIPDKIEERFHVKCWKPERVLKELLKK